MSSENLEQQTKNDLSKNAKSLTELAESVATAAKQRGVNTDELAEGGEINAGVLVPGGSSTTLNIGEQKNYFTTPTVIPSEQPYNFPRSSSTTFVGRDSVLKELHKLLDSPRSNALALCGMGGIGKTEIAIHYAQTYTKDYPGGICWVNCRDAEVGPQILNFARSYLGAEIPKNTDLTRQLEICWAQWHKQGNVLILFDDVPLVERIVPYFPHGPLRFKVLITTRQITGSRGITFIPVNALDETVSRRVLGINLGEADPRLEQEPEKVAELCHWLDYLPLGLNLVGRYLERRKDVTLSIMLERLKAESLRQESVQGKDGIVAALEISWQELSPEAQNLGYTLSLFTLAPIPWWMVELMQPGYSSQQLEAWRDDELCQFSLLQRQGHRVYRFHHLTREFLQYKLNEMADADDRKRTFCHQMVRLIEQLLSDESPEEAANTSPLLVLDHIKDMAIIQPHLMEAQDLFTTYQALLLTYFSQGFYEEAALWGEQCKNNLTGRIESSLIAVTLYYLAAAYTNQSRYKEAEDLLVELLSTDETVFENYDAVQAEVLDLLGSIRAVQGDFEQAQKDCRKALELKETLNGSDSPTVVSSLGALAEVCRIRGQYEEAEQLYTRAFDIYSMVGSENEKAIQKLYVVFLFINMSVLLLEQGRNQECEMFGEQAIEIVEEAFDTAHPLYAACLTNLAGASFNQGDHQKAEQLCKQAIAINEEKNNIRYPSYTASLIYLATVYMAQGRFDEASEQYQRALDIRRQIYGEKHHQVAEVLVPLAMTYMAQEIFDVAEKYLAQGREMYQDTLGIGHPKYGQLLCDLVGLRVNQERYGEAEELLHEAIQVFEAAYGENSPKMCEKLVFLGFFLMVRERYSEAEELFQRSLNIMIHVFGEDDPNVCEYMLLIAELAYYTGHNDRADELYDKAIRIYEQERNQKINPDFSQGFMSLIEFYKTQKRYQAIASLYERLIRTTRRLLGNNHANIALFLSNLATLKIQERDFEKAIELYQEALDVRQEIFSETPNHPLIAMSMVNLAYAYHALNHFQEAKNLYLQARQIRISVYGESHHQVGFVEKALANLDVAWENYGRSATQSLPGGQSPALPDRPPLDVSATDTPSLTITNPNNVAAKDRQSSMIAPTDVETLEQKITIQAGAVNRQMETVQALEQREAELATQLAQLQAQQETLEAVIQRYEQQSLSQQAALLIVAEPLVNLVHHERSQLEEPLSAVLADLEEQQQQYKDTWDRLQTAILEFNSYQIGTDEIRVHLTAHYQADEKLSQFLPLNQRHVEQLLKNVKDHLNTLDEILKQAHEQHERSRQKTPISFST